MSTQSGAEGFGFDVHPAHLDLECPELVPRGQPLQVFQVERRLIDDLERRQEWRRDLGVAAEVIDAFGNPPELASQRESVDQSRARERGIGVVDEAAKGNDRSEFPGRAVAIGPCHILRQPRRSPPARSKRAKPARRLLALTAQADQFDLEF